MAFSNVPNSDATLMSDQYETFLDSFVTMGSSKPVASDMFVTLAGASSAKLESGMFAPPFAAGFGASQQAQQCHFGMALDGPRGYESGDAWLK